MDNSHKRVVLMPQYMKNFKCIGSSCEDTCCAGWNVLIDKKTYKKYKKCNNTNLKKEFDKNIGRNRDNPMDFSYARIKLNEDGACPFLTQDRLCKIHSNLGEEYLSNTCSKYPRIHNIVDGAMEESATMSCPEIVRIALLNEDIMEFENIEQETMDKSISYVLNTKNKQQEYFWELRTFTIQVLQCREYKLWERLTILGIFYQSIQQIILENKIEEIPELINEYIVGIENGLFDKSLEEVPVKETVQLELLRRIIDKRIKKGLANKRYIDCFNEFIKGIKHSEKITNEEIIKNYKQAYDKHYSPIMEKHEYVLENYLVNYVFKNLFPFSPHQNIFENFVLMVVHYSLIKMHLIGMAGYHEENFGIDHILKLIQSFGKSIEHNNNYLKEIINYLKENEYLTLSHLLLLIKN